MTGDPSGLIYGTDNLVTTDAYAAYTQGTYTFNDNWALTLGIRYARDEKSAFEQRAGYEEFNVADPNGFGEFALPAFEGLCTAPPPFGFGLTSCAQAGLTPLAMLNIFMGSAAPNFNPLPTPNAPIVPTCALDDPDCATPLRLRGIPLTFSDASERSKKKWSRWTWRANLEWTPNEDSLFYLGATTGYRSGGFSLGLLDTQGEVLDDDGSVNILLNGPPATYDAEDVLALEFGYKGTLFQDRLQVFSALYWYDYKDYQDQVDGTNDTTGGDQQIVINVPKARNMGFEIEANWLATDNWLIGGNYSYTRSEYRSDVFIVENDNPARPEVLFRDVVPDPNNPGDTIITNATVRNLRGNDLKQIPRHKGTILTTYDWNLAAGNLTLGANLSYTGLSWQTGIKRNLDKIPARYRANAYLAFTDSQQRYTIRAFIDNITDEGAARNIQTGGQGAAWRRTASYLYPRFYGLDVTVRFSNL